MSYGGEYRVTLGSKSYDTLKAIHGGRGEEGDNVLVEEYINRDGVAVLFRTVLNQGGAEHFKVENWKQSPKTTINDQTYYLATETCLRDAAAYR